MTRTVDIQGLQSAGTSNAACPGAWQLMLAASWGPSRGTVNQSTQSLAFSWALGGLQHATHRSLHARAEADENLSLASSCGLDVLQNGTGFLRGRILRMSIPKGARSFQSQTWLLLPSRWSKQTQDQLRFKGREISSGSWGEEPSVYTGKEKVVRAHWRPPHGRLRIRLFLTCWKGS